MSAHRISRRAEVVVVAVLVGAATLSIFGSSANSPGQPVGLSQDVHAESTALYCTGFGGVRTVVPASVRFFNIADAPRHVDVTEATGHGDFLHESFTVNAHAQYDMKPTEFPGHSYYGLAAVVAGGGVSAAVHPTASPAIVVPCVSQGASRWNFTGLSTVVGTNAELTMLNPTATPAVVNLSALTSGGFSAPQSFQGIVVKPHGLSTVNLGTEIVNSSSVFLNVHAVRGLIVPAVAESWGFSTSGDVVVAGSPPPASQWLFPSVPTSDAVTSSVALANPTNQPAHVTVRVQIPGYQISPFNVDLSAQSSMQLIVSPSSRVPAAGAAQVSVLASSPIAATLLTTIKGSKIPWVFSASAPATTVVVSDANRHRLASISVINSGRRAARVRFSVFASSNATGSYSWEQTVAAGSSVSITNRVRLAHVEGTYVVVTSDQPVAVGATPSGPKGTEALAQNASGAR